MNGSKERKVGLLEILSVIMIFLAFIFIFHIYYRLNLIEDVFLSALDGNIQSSSGGLVRQGYIENGSGMQDGQGQQQEPPVDYIIGDDSVPSLTSVIGVREFLGVERLGVEHSHGSIEYENYPAYSYKYMSRDVESDSMSYLDYLARLGYIWIRDGNESSHYAVFGIESVREEHIIVLGLGYSTLRGEIDVVVQVVPGELTFEDSEDDIGDGGEF